MSTSASDVGLERLERKTTFSDLQCSVSQGTESADEKEKQTNFAPPWIDWALGCSFSRRWPGTPKPLVRSSMYRFLLFRARWGRIWRWCEICAALGVSGVSGGYPTRDVDSCTKTLRGSPSPLSRSFHAHTKSRVSKDRTPGLNVPRKQSEHAFPRLAPLGSGCSPTGRGISCIDMRIGHGCAQQCEPGTAAQARANRA